MIVRTCAAAALLRLREKKQLLHKPQSGAFIQQWAHIKQVTITGSSDLPLMKAEGGKRTSCVSWGVRTRRAWCVAVTGWTRDNADSRAASAPLMTDCLCVLRNERRGLCRWARTILTTSWSWILTSTTAITQRGRRRKFLLYFQWRLGQIFTPTWIERSAKKKKKSELCKTPWSLCRAQRRSSSAAQTYNFPSASSSSSCSTDTGGEPPSHPGVAKQKVTLFLGGGPLTSCSLRGLQSARCFQRMAQLLTTLRRRRHFCRTQEHSMGSNLKKYTIWNMEHFCGSKQRWNI